MKTFLSLLVFALASTQVTSAFADAAKPNAAAAAGVAGAAAGAAVGAAIYKKGNCTTCHKADGAGNPHPQVGLMKGPVIAGLSEKYIYEQLVAVKSGTRPNGINGKKNYTSMKTFITKLTDEEFKQVAKYVSELGKGKTIKGFLEK
jgi:cytochrome c553